MQYHYYNIASITKRKAIDIIITQINITMIVKPAIGKNIVSTNFSNLSIFKNILIVNNIAKIENLFIITKYLCNYFICFIT